MAEKYLSKSTISEAFDLYKKGAMLVKEGSPEWIQFSAGAGLLGWILDDGNYVPQIEAILSEVRKLVKEKVVG